MPGLDGQKMSKSYNNAIALREDPESVTKKIRTMPTDPARVRRTDPGEPERCPVWQLHQVYSDDATRDWVQTGCRSAGIGCLDCKQPVIDAVIREQQPMRERAQRYLDDPDAGAQHHRRRLRPGAQAGAARRCATCARRWGSRAADAARCRCTPNSGRRTGSGGSRLCVAPGGRVLDVACGGGRHTRLFAGARLRGGRGRPRAPPRSGPAGECARRPSRGGPRAGSLAAGRRALRRDRRHELPAPPAVSAPARRARCRAACCCTRPSPSATSASASRRNPAFLLRAARTARRVRSAARDRVRGRLRAAPAAGDGAADRRDAAAPMAPTGRKASRSARARRPRGCRIPASLGRRTPS